MKSSIFQDITPFSPLKINGRFGGKYRLKLQCWRESAKQGTTTLLRIGFLLASYFDPEDGAHMYLRRVG
jgi:hypothetical protein